MKNALIPTPDSNTPKDEPSSSGITEDDRLRSKYMLHIIREERNSAHKTDASLIPRILVQFWDNIESIPADVRKCMNSWQLLEDSDFERLLFDDKSSETFISNYFDEKHVEAFKRCRHPAMRSDYFRLCFILMKGGLYVDADDTYQGVILKHLFQDNRIKLQPLCYDSSTDSMIDTTDFLINLPNKPDLTFYVNNNPIIAPPDHPVIRMALERSTSILLNQATDEAQDVQSTTGPGNLTASLVRHAIEIEHDGKARDFLLLNDWDMVSVSQWPLDYRKDKRNWRLWDGQDV